MSSHRRAYSAILALIASFHALPAMACGWWDPTGACNAVQELGDQTNKAVDKLDKQLTETRDALAKSVDLVAKAVPGERWARLLDGLGSPDPEARKQTKEFLQRLASIADDPAAESKYKLVAAFDFDELKPFHVDFERFAGADRSFAEAFVLQHSANLDATPKRTNLDPITEAQLRSQLLSKADEILSLAIGPATGQTDIPCGSGPGIVQPQCAKLTFANTISAASTSSPIPFVQPLQQFLKAKEDALADLTRKFETKRDAIRNDLVDMALMAYSYRETRMDNLTSYLDWSLVDGRNFVIVVMDKDTYEQHTEDWTIKIRVAQSEHPEVSLYNRPTQVLKREGTSRAGGLNEITHRYPA